MQSSGTRDSANRIRFCAHQRDEVVVKGAFDCEPSLALRENRFHGPGTVMVVILRALER